jgi:hypothetical protein
MKRSKPKFSNQRINDREDDFLLADVFALDDDTQLVDIRFDTDLAEEDAIDRLLFRSGFDPINEQQAEPQPVTKTETPPSAAPVPVIDDVQSALATMGLGNNETTRPAPKLEASADEAGAAEEQRNPYTSPSVLQALYKTKVSSSIPPVTQAEPPPARPAPPQTERPASAPEPQPNAQILAQLHANQAALEEQLAHLNRRSKAAIRGLGRAAARLGERGVRRSQRHPARDARRDDEPDRERLAPQPHEIAQELPRERPHHTSSAGRARVA